MSKNNSENVADTEDTINTKPIKCGCYTAEECSKLVSQPAVDKRATDSEKRDEIPNSTWSLEETYALMNNCYDPRNFGQTARSYKPIPKLDDHRNKNKKDNSSWIKEFDNQDEESEEVERQSRRANKRR